MGEKALKFEKLATEDDLAKLVQLYQETEIEAEVAALQKAIAVSVSDISDLESRKAEFSNILKLINGDKRDSLFDPFAQFGNPKGLELMVTLTQNKDSYIQENAIRALSNWPVFEASNHQLELVKSLNNAEQKTQLLRGYIRLTRKSDIPDYRKVELLQQAMAAINDIKNQKLILLGLSEINSIEAVKYFVRSHLILLG